MFDEVTPDQAHKLLQAGGAVYLDVRTPEEFAEGHAPGAKNIPLMLRDPASGRMVPNQEFLNVAQANLKLEDKLVVGCKSGGRSATACQVLEQAGYKSLKNIAGGFHGKPGGNPGWTALNLPVENGEGGEGQYEKLRGKAGA
ncbi:MAG: rhodanese-like domain-containing protein [Planctomycetes bacterium]|nr:rhodanese-like domain-containing protein [Planctomycetota bacterium]